MFEGSGGVCYGMSDPDNPTASDGTSACNSYYSSSLNLDWSVWCNKQYFLKVSKRLGGSLGTKNPFSEREKTTTSNTRNSNVENGDTESLVSKEF